MVTSKLLTCWTRNWNTEVFYVYLPVPNVENKEIMVWFHQIAFHKCDIKSEKALFFRNQKLMDKRERKIKAREYR